MGWTQVSARRMRRQGLTGPPLSDPAEIARRMCGVHAQIMTAAEVSIGLRSAALTCADVGRALWSDRTLVKAHGPRGTVHLLPADDLARWTAALAAVPDTASPARDMAMTGAQTDAVLDAVHDSLAAAETMTLDELDRAVVARAGPWAGDLVMPAFQTFWPRWRQKLGEAARRGHLIFGPACGRHVTYTDPGRWLGRADPAPGPDEATDWLLSAYLAAYAPARPADFARWLATDPGWARRVFERHADRLEPVDLEGVQAWTLAGQAPAEPEPTVRLLPYFDAYVVAGQPRELLFPGRAGERARPPSGQAGNFPVVLVDGVVAGIWHQRRAGPRLDVTVELLTRVTRRIERGVATEAERVAALQQRTCRLRFADVTVGPHA